jgi:hypothetical protein
MIHKKKNKKKKYSLGGSATIFALFLMLILVVATIGIMTTAAIERKVSISTGNSTNAFQIAESGMEITSQYFKSNFNETLGDVGSCLLGIITLNDYNTVRFKDNTFDPQYITDCTALISEVKIIKSTGTTNRETRAIEQDVFLRATKLLLHFNGVDESAQIDPDYVEDSSYYYYENQGMLFQADASLDYDEKKIGQASAYFDGDGDYLLVPSNNEWNFGVEDFTIDFWIRTSVIQPYSTFIKIGSETDEGLSIYQKDLFSLCFLINGSEYCEPFTPTTDTWEHIALVRKGPSVRLFVNGEQKGSDEADSSNITMEEGNGSISIGGSFQPNQFFNGHIDELRISRGVTRWWDAPFDTPIAEYWSD